MHLPIIHYLVQTHGLVALVPIVGAYKYAKYRIFCWRKDRVNERVRDMVEERLSSTTAKEEEREQNRRCGGVAIKRRNQIKPTAHMGEMCALCACPLWLRHEDSDCSVQLLACGCMMHGKCLLEAARKQSGIGLPDSMDFEALVGTASRVFGLDPIDVASINCPRCETVNQSWRKVKERGSVVAKSSTIVLARALRRGDALSMVALRQALLDDGDSSNVGAEHLQRWRVAAQDESSFCDMMKCAGPAAAKELSELLEEDIERYSKLLSHRLPEHKRSAKAFDLGSLDAAEVLSADELTGDEEQSALEEAEQTRVRRSAHCCRIHYAASVSSSSASSGSVAVQHVSSEQQRRHANFLWV
eukprot:gnl/TRDRNA2_/TRDRNA2_50312_c0_seq1.p1 gnl/TRDRNA2_/TRDRNA2_50312_c0~~gnl/TRDRNA2_/TRDRNA2_50312_c0_seq1.p1  ORF type:complete len:358 (+),score=56.00 gnl/TRDRNA2_/TRDRNA2_50312_c0_seq1:137-1210(+)